MFRSYHKPYHSTTKTKHENDSAPMQHLLVIHWTIVESRSCFMRWANSLFVCFVELTMAFHWCLIHLRGSNVTRALCPCIHSARYLFDHILHLINKITFVNRIILYRLLAINFYCIQIKREYTTLIEMVFVLHRRNVRMANQLLLCS